MPLGSSDAGLVGAPHGAVHRDVAFYTAGTKDGGGDRGRDACLVAGVADGNSVAGDHAGDGAQIELLVLRRVGRGGVHEDKIFLAEDVDRVVDLGVGAHTGGSNDGLAGLTDVLKEVVVGEGGRCDLVDRGIEVLHEVDGALVPWGRRATGS